MLSLPRDWPRAEGRAAIPGPSGPGRVSRPFPPLPRHLAGALSTPQGPSRRSWSKVCLERPLPVSRPAPYRKARSFPAAPAPPPPRVGRPPAGSSPHPRPIPSGHNRPEATPGTRPRAPFWGCLSLSVSPRVGHTLCHGVTARSPRAGGGGQDHMSFLNLQGLSS